MNASWFPLDVIKMRIRIVSEFLPGTTSMGKRKRVKLVDPLIRMQRNHKSDQAVGAAFRNQKRNAVGKAV